MWELEISQSYGSPRLVTEIALPLPSHNKNIHDLERSPGIVMFLFGCRSGTEASNGPMTDKYEALME
jgi:hypothetical protein